MHLIHKEIVVELPETKIIRPRHNLGQAKLGFSNEVRGILRDMDENILQDTGWQKNAWTTYGKKNLAQGFRSMNIGTGNSVLDIAWTDLEIPATTPSSATVIDYANAGAPNYDFYATVWRRFAAGTATGLITEVGQYVFNVPQGLCCRAVLLTPINKGADNQLDMYYKTTCTPDLVDQTGSVAIAGVNYDYTLRQYNVQTYEQAFNGVYPETSCAGSSAALNALVTDPKTTPYESMTRINLASDFENKIYQWSSIAYLDTCNFEPDGIKSCYSRLSFPTATGTDAGLSLGLVATDGPNIGGGVPKVNTQYFTVDWNITWDGV